MAKPVRQYGSSKGVQVSAPPSAEEIEKMHMNADTDVRGDSLHHTLGSRETQASPGNHLHDGGDSNLLLEGYTITGSHSAGTSLNSIVACLVRLGATDQSSA